MKKTLFAVAAVSVLSAVSSFAQITTTSFGQIPGVPNGQNPYSGGGIPYDRSENAVITAIPGSSDTVTLALATTAHGAPPIPVPTDNSAGTYFVQTGLMGGRSVWNFDLYMSSASGTLDGYSFLITVINEGNSKATAFDPVTGLGGNAGLPAAVGNSESLDFAFLKTPLAYDPTKDDTYDVSLSAFKGGNLIGTDQIKIVAGVGATPVPEPTTVIAGALMLLPFGFSAVRAIRNRKTTVNQ